MPNLQANRPLTEKPLMSRIWHKIVIRELKTEKNMLNMLNYLSVHTMDVENYPELVTEIEDRLLDLFTHKKYGYIAEWIYRQWRNSLDYEIEIIEPLKVNTKKRIVKEGDYVPSFGEKSVSLRVRYFNRLLREKYAKNPEEYKREKEMNEKPSSSISELTEQRGTKRKLVEDQ